MSDQSHDRSPQVRDAIIAIHRLLDMAQRCDQLVASLSQPNSLTQNEINSFAEEFTDLFSDIIDAILNTMPTTLDLLRDSGHAPVIKIEVNSNADIENLLQLLEEKFGTKPTHWKGH